MDGYAVARLLRAIPALNNVVLVAITGYGHEEDRRRSQEAGFDMHLVKPLDLDDLEKRLAAPETFRALLGKAPTPALFPDDPTLFIAGRGRGDTAGVDHGPKHISANADPVGTGSATAAGSPPRTTAAPS